MINRELVSQMAFRTVVFLIATAFAGRSTATAQAQPKPAEEVYKNIKVLHGTPADELLPAMQFISSSLGVRCDHCHVERAFEKDDKEPKQVARQMIAMMFQINRDNFAGERKVTCYSCHRGAPRPAAIPILAGESPGARPTPSGVRTQDSADLVVERYLRAIGGAEAVLRITSRAEKGRVTLAEGVEVPVEIYTRQPAMRAMVMHVPSGDVTTVFDGRAGWTAAANRPVRELSRAENDAAKMDADPQFPIHLKQFFSKLEYVEEEIVAGDAMKILQGTRPGMSPVKLYFHSQSGFLTRVVRYVESPLGLNPTRIDYSDYREQDGVKIPFQWTVTQPEGRFTVHLDQVQLNVPIDDARFRKPSR